MKMPHLPPAVPHLVLALVGFVCIVVMVLIAGIRGAPSDFNYVRSSRSVKTIMQGSFMVCRLGHWAMRWRSSGITMSAP